MTPAVFGNSNMILHEVSNVKHYFAFLFFIYEINSQILKRDKCPDGGHDDAKGIGTCKERVDVKYTQNDTNKRNNKIIHL